MLLPELVFGIIEVRRLKRELEAIDEAMRQTKIRSPGESVDLPKVSRLLDGLATDNSRNLLQAEDRQALAAFLAHVETKAPTIHISFASDPSATFIARMVKWLRGNIDPTILLQTGLQPTIVAGCVVRTKNKVFDFSLRQRFSEQKALLVQAIDGDRTKVAVAPAPESLSETEFRDV